jgi:superfamily I DNA and RNA helicase
LLVLPNVSVIAGSVLFPRAQIVDASDMAELAQRVDQAIGGIGIPNAAIADRVCAFLENTFQVLPNVAHQISQVHVASRRLAEGLSTWVPRIAAPLGIVRVDGTAGSGKTQLALALLRDARIKGLRAAYLCFNRSLADHMARLAPATAQVETFHELAVRHKERTDPDWRIDQQGAFDIAGDDLLAHLANQIPDLDLLILDEVQDFHPEWVEGLLKRLTNSGRAYLLEDPDQQLYRDRVDFAIEGAVVLQCPDNYRSPRQLVHLINHLGLTRQAINPCGPVDGELPEPIEYLDERDLLRATVQAVKRCLAKGFALKDIVLVTHRGRERSVLHAKDALGEWRLRRATGAFDAARNPVWTAGELTVESVRRFKGQAAPAVVLTECDFGELDDLTRRMLFVGMTRSQMHLEWVVSRSAASAITKALG